jgi:Rieske Fe-S protein
MALSQTRRRFLKLLTIGTATATGLGCPCCATREDSTPELSPDSVAFEEDGTIRIALDRAPELGAVGASAKISARHIIIARIGEEEYVAASNQCTHNGKAIEYDHGAGLFLCVSSSEFGLDGSRVSGPAERNLPTFETFLEDATTLVIVT